MELLTHSLDYLQTDNLEPFSCLFFFLVFIVNKHNTRGCAVNKSLLSDIFILQQKN
jgi:hypothetical protein